MAKSLSWLLPAPHYDHLLSLSLSPLDTPATAEAVGEAGEEADSAAEVEAAAVVPEVDVVPVVTEASPVSASSGKQTH